MKRIGEILCVLSGALALAGCGQGETGTGTGTGGGPSAACEAASASGIEVAATDVHGGMPYALGYPPYAIDGCRLAYVSGAGDLRVRDLATGKESTLAPAADQPRRPAMEGDLVAWEATIDGKHVVQLSGPDGVVTASGPFDHAGEPRVGGGALVMTAWLAADDMGDTDVYLYDPAKESLVAIATGPAQQRFADISAKHVAWSDFAEDPDGAFGGSEDDAADVVVQSRATGERITRLLPGKQAFPILGASGRLGFLDWGLVHPEPKFSAYGLHVGDIDGPVEDDELAVAIETRLPYVRPIARGDMIEWVSSPFDGATALYRMPADLSGPAELVRGFQDVDVFGPSASDAITLVGTRASGGATRLEAFAR